MTQPRVIQRSGNVPSLAQLAGVPRGAIASSLADTWRTTNPRIGYQERSWTTANAQFGASLLTSNTAIAVTQGASNYLESCVYDLTTGLTTRGATAVINSGTAVDSCAIARISDTQAIAIYNVQATGPSVAVLTKSGSTVSGGSPTAVSGTPSTSAVAAAVNIPGTSSVVIAYTLNTNAIGLRTVDSALSFGAVANNGLVGYRQRVVMFSATNGLLIYQGSVSTFVEAVAFTISGTTITMGTPVNVGQPVTNTHQGLSILSPTRAICTYFGAGSSNFYAALIDVSGTTASSPGATSFYTTSSGDVGVVGLSASKAMAFHAHTTTGGPTVTMLNISNSTITASTPFVLDGGAGCSRPVALAISPTDVFAPYYGSPLIAHRLGPTP